MPRGETGRARRARAAQGNASLSASIAMPIGSSPFAARSRARSGVETGPTPAAQAAIADRATREREALERPQRRRLGQYPRTAPCASGMRAVICSRRWLAELRYTGEVQRDVATFEPVHHGLCQRNACARSARPTAGSAARRSGPRRNRARKDALRGPLVKRCEPLSAVRRAAHARARSAPALLVIPCERALDVDELASGIAALDEADPA